MANKDDDKKKYYCGYCGNEVNTGGERINTGGLENEINLVNAIPIEGICCIVRERYGSF